jgi:hypothetical protein
MTKRQAVEALDNSMHDIMSRPAMPFGGKMVVFGGYFRKVLPVVQKGSRAQIIDSSLRRSYLWECMHHLKIERNMRAHSDPWFADVTPRPPRGRACYPWQLSRISRLAPQTNTSLFCALCPHSCAPGINFPVGHPSSNCSRPSTLNLEFFSDELPEKKLQLVDMSILSILLSPG